MGMEFSLFLKIGRLSFSEKQAIEMPAPDKSNAVVWGLEIVLARNQRFNQGMTACTSFEYELSLAEESTAVTT